MSLEAIPLDEVIVPEKRLRQPKSYKSLAQSIKAVGLLNPITVTPEHVLIAGLRRLTACRSLGWETIPAVITDADAELAEIDENLCREELTALEHAQHLRRRKELWEALFPTTKHGANQHTKGEDAPPRFTADSAEKTGRSERTIRRAVRLAEDLDDEAAELIASTPTADNAQELARLSKLSPENQRAVAAQLASGEVTRVKVAQRRIRAAAPLPDLAGDVPDSVQIKCCTVQELLADLTAAEVDVGFMTADPPWPYDNQRINGSTDGHYESYGIDDIARDIDAAYDVAADNCYLAIWCTGPMLKAWFRAEERLGIEDIEGDGLWDGFRWEFLSAGIWNKRPDNTGKIGAGFHWRGDGEFLLLYRKGKPEPLTTISNAFGSKRTEHSEKPVARCYELLRAFCEPGAPVGDLYCGRAPTARACLGLGHPYYGCDTSEERVHAALSAIEEARKAGRESRERAKSGGVQVSP